MMKNRNAALAAITALFLVSGCGITLDGKKIDYRSAAKLPPLEVPPDLTSPSGDDRYAVPDSKSASFSTYARGQAGQPQPGASAILPSVEKARIERSGNQRWLVVNAPPEQVWPVVRQFWNDVGFTVKTETPVAGVMETDWAENRAKIPEDGIRKLIGKALDVLYSTSERDKFRTRLERGVEPGTTEIYVSHRGMSEVYASEGKDQTVWQPRPADPELEAEMLRRLMARFGVEEAKASAQLAAAAQPERAQLQKAADGTTQLTVNDAFDRAWRRVGLALDRVGFTVEDRDRSKGLYFVRYIDPDIGKREETGWFGKLAFWRSNDDKGIDKRAQYRIHVSESGPLARVAVENQAGATESSVTANRILTLLYEQLK